MRSGVILDGSIVLLIELTDLALSCGDRALKASSHSDPIVPYGRFGRTVSYVALRASLSARERLSVLSQRVLLYGIIRRGRAAP